MLLGADAITVLVISEENLDLFGSFAARLRHGEHGERDAQDAASGVRPEGASPAAGRRTSW